MVKVSVYGVSYDYYYFSSVCVDDVPDATFLLSCNVHFLPGRRHPRLVEEGGGRGTSIVECTVKGL